MRSNQLGLWATVTAACAGVGGIGGIGACAAYGQHTGDVVLTVEAGRIATTERVGVPERIFLTALGASSSNFTDSPGFDCVPGTFASTSSIGFRVLKAVRTWQDGNFDTIAPVGFDIDFGPLLVSTPSTDDPVTGFSLRVGANGQWHRHLGYTLQDPATDGLYLLEMSLFSTDGGVSPSLPFWIIFNQNRSATELLMAGRWTEIHLGGRCPSDFDDGSGTGTNDGGVGIEDLLYYLQIYEAGDATADLDNGTATGSLDGGVGIEDLLYFLARYDSGC